jgi:hypothetical protein
MPSQNRDKGHRWERTVRLSLLPLYPDCQTSRNDSRTEDAKCIDFTCTGDLAIQAKNYKVKPNFHEELAKMDTDKLKVLAFKWNKVRGGEFAVMRWSDFIKLLENQNG